MTSVRLLYHGRGDRFWSLSAVDHYYKTTWLYIPTCILAKWRLRLPKIGESNITLLLGLYILAKVADSHTLILSTEAYWSRNLYLENQHHSDDRCV